MWIPSETPTVRMMPPHFGRGDKRKTLLLKSAIKQTEVHAAKWGLHNRGVIDVYTDDEDQAGVRWKVGFA